MPLIWAHAEYIKLSRSLSERKVFDMPPAPAKRYLVEKKHADFESWRFIDKIQLLSKGKNLRIEVLAPATLHWSTDNWQTVHDIETRDTKLGVYVVDLPADQFSSEVRWQSQCIRCDTCDGFPCLVEAKSDADNNCIRPIFGLPNVTLLTGAYVSKLTTNSTGTEITGVKVEFDGGKRKETYTAPIVVVACGAINSAALLLRSANSSHPTGLANSSDLVGRNFMFHKAAIVLSIGLKPNASKYMKTVAVHDFYFGENDFPYPMGGIQLVGSFKWEMMKGEAPTVTPSIVLKTMKSHSVPW